MSARFLCPCCGHRVLDATPGSFQVCPTCFWEDDVQFPWPTAACGANRVSLIEAQRIYQDFGAYGLCTCEGRATRLRLPSPSGAGSHGGQYPDPGTSGEHRFGQPARVSFLDAAPHS